MAKIKFEVGKRYAWNGRFVLCTKRTDKSVWFNDTRYNITGGWGSDGVEKTNYHTADNYDDIEVQRDRKLKSLLEAAKDVCEDDEYSYVYEGEEELYELCHDLKECLTEFLQHRTKLDDIND